jgi:hypothetical protein
MHSQSVHKNDVFGIIVHVEPKIHFGHTCRIWIQSGFFFREKEMIIHLLPRITSFIVVSRNNKHTAAITAYNSHFRITEQRYFSISTIKKWFSHRHSQYYCCLQQQTLLLQKRI